MGTARARKFAPAGAAGALEQSPRVAASLNDFFEFVLGTVGGRLWHMAGAGNLLRAGAAGALEQTSVVAANLNEYF